VVRYDPAVHVKVDPCGLADLGWAVHVSLEVPLQRVLALVPILVLVPIQVPAQVLDQYFGMHRMEAP